MDDTEIKWLIALLVAAAAAAGEVQVEGNPQKFAELMGLMDTIKGIFGKAKEEAAELSEKAAPMVDKAKETAKETMEKVKEEATELGEKAAPMVDKAKDSAKEAWEKVEDRVDEIIRQVFERTGGGHSVETRHVLECIAKIANRSRVAHTSSQQGKMGMTGARRTRRRHFNLD